MWANSEKKKSVICLNSGNREQFLIKAIRLPSNIINMPYAVT